MAPHYPKLLALQLDPVEWAGTWSAEMSLQRQLSTYRYGDPLKMSYQSPLVLVTFSFARGIHWSWQ